MATRKISDKPLVRMLEDGESILSILSDGNNRRIETRFLRALMTGSPPVLLEAAQGAPSFDAISTYTKASEATPTPEQMRGMTVVLGDGTALTVDTLRSDPDYESKKSAAYARGESLWFIDDSMISLGYYSLCSSAERGGLTWWCYMFPEAGTYTLMMLFTVTVEAGIYASDDLLGGALLLDRWQSKQDKLAFDATPTQGSLNPVTSDGVASAIENARELPSVTAADNGKIAKVVNGAWAAVEEPDVSQIGM